MLKCTFFSWNFAKDEDVYSFFCVVRAYKFFDCKKEEKKTRQEKTWEIKKRDESALVTDCSGLYSRQLNQEQRFCEGNKISFEFTFI